MYFGTYQLPSQHRQFDTLPYEVPCRGPSLFARLLAWFARVIH